MNNDNGWFIVFGIIALFLGIAYIVGIATSDLPDWIKVVLLA